MDESNGKLQQKPLSVDDEMSIIHENYDEKWHSWANQRTEPPALKGTLLSVKNAKNVIIRTADGNTLDVRGGYTKKAEKKVGELRELIGQEVHITDSRERSLVVEPYQPDLVNTEHVLLLSEQKVADIAIPRGMGRDFIWKAEERHVLPKIEGKIIGLRHHGFLLDTEKYGRVELVVSESLSKDNLPLVEKVRDHLNQPDPSNPKQKMLNHPVRLSLNGGALEISQGDKVIAADKLVSPLDVDTIMRVDNLDQFLLKNTRRLSNLKVSTTRDEDIGKLPEGTITIESVGVEKEQIEKTPTQNEKDTKIPSQVESATPKIENTRIETTSEAPRISKNYVLTHRQDLPETKPDSAIKAVTKQRGTLVGIEGSRFVLEKGGEQFKVETNKKLDVDAFSTGIGKKVNLHLNQTGERLSMIYLAGEKETDVVSVEQKFQGPAIPFGLVKAVDMSDEKNAHKTIHGELVAAYESATKQVMEVQTENGRLLVHGPKTEFSLPTIKKAIGKQVELKSEDHKLKIATASRGVEIA